MALVMRTPSQVTGTGTNVTVTEPTGAASGDIEIYLAVFAKGLTITQPAGWTPLYSGTSTTSFQFVVAYIVRGGSAPNLTWTASGSNYREVFVACINSNTAATIALDSQSASGTISNAASHAPDPPSTTAVASASMAIAGGIWWTGAGAGGYTPSTGYTLQTSAGAFDGFLESKSLSASGAENPSAVGNIAAGTSDYWDGFTVTFAETSGDTLMGAICL